MADLTRDEARHDLITGVNTHECICEALRQTYDDVAQLPDGPLKESMTDKLTTCFLMAKKMQNRLNYYWRQYEPDRQHVYHPLPGAAERLQMRQARLEA